MTYFLCYLAGLVTGFIGMALFAGGADQAERQRLLDLIDKMKESQR